MLKYGVTACLSTRYHTKQVGKFEDVNRGFMRILERNRGRKSCSSVGKLDDALWAFRKRYKDTWVYWYKLVYGGLFLTDRGEMGQAVWGLIQALRGRHPIDISSSNISVFVEEDFPDCEDLSTRVSHPQLSFGNPVTNLFD
ncbi:hypothetical protein Tco_1352822 [Tanacetum coccineum]